MKTTTLFKTLAVFVTFALNLTSCQSEMDEPQSQIPYEDMPIKSLSASRSDVGTVANGECVIGAIQYCGRKVGKTISRESIIEYFGDKVIRSESGSILGIDLNTDDWHRGLNHWFNATLPLGQNDLISKIQYEGKIACCRIVPGPVFNTVHAVVLIGVHRTNPQFKYYDPVNPGEHYVNFKDVYDPRIISAKE